MGESVAVASAEGAVGVVDEGSGVAEGTTVASSPVSAACVGGPGDGLGIGTPDVGVPLPSPQLVSNSSMIGNNRARLSIIAFYSIRLYH
jgi:hypothetical protein